MSTGSSTRKNNMEDLEIMKHRSALGDSSHMTEHIVRRSNIFKDRGTHAILAGLVFIAKTQMQPKCYSQKRIKYTGYTHNAILLSHIEQ